MIYYTDRTGLKLTLMLVGQLLCLFDIISSVTVLLYCQFMIRKTLNAWAASVFYSLRGSREGERRGIKTYQNLSIKITNNRPQTPPPPFWKCFVDPHMKYS